MTSSDNNVWLAMHDHIQYSTVQYNDNNVHGPLLHI